MARAWDVVTYAVRAGVKGDAQRELWRELCTRLEAVAADPRYSEIRASGDGVPDRCR